MTQSKQKYIASKYTTKVYTISLWAKALVWAFIMVNVYIPKIQKYPYSHDSDRRNGFSTRQNMQIHSFACAIGLIAEERQFQRGGMPLNF